MDWIEEFYYGNIRPVDHAVHNKEYSAALHTICECEKKLQEMLSGDAWKLVLELTDAYSTFSALSGTENFKLGFRLGVNMIGSCNCGEEML
ncbi:MAG: hypothetical protein IJX64_04485 [Clostridia bacterium]|nr:hypothetical protein [Clostridia bacterium]